MGMGPLSVLIQLSMTYQDLKNKYKYIKPCYKPNKMKFPENVIPNTEEGVEEFNEIMEVIHELVDSKELDGRRTMPLTKSGGIRKTPLGDHQNTYAIIVTKSMVEVLLCYKEYYRFHFRRVWRKEKDELSGTRSFYIFKETLKKFNVDIEDHAVSKEEGLMYKSMIPSPIIKVNEDIIDKTLVGVHHIDIRSSHMAGMAEAVPELRSPIEYLYNKRKKHKEYKSVLTHTWGYCQSVYVDFKYSFLSLVGIQSTNKKVNKITDMLIKAGRKPFLWNTDGVWYEGEIFHGEGEGKTLGMWHNDHVNCTLRAKSKGTYEFIEDGVYTPVARGQRELDKIKDRDDWEWGDIYRCGKILSFQWDDENEKLIKENQDEDFFDF